ncbi:uncharacterized protein LOC142521829 [Primulina tabacum]|uniref:uncharacterized protein LOC142521829 n=1 Tax=Primulina tabacum TaxID=48773 RepID=UPI003F5AD5A4
MAAANAPAEELARLEKWRDNDLQAKSYTLASRSNKLATVKELMKSCQRERASVHEHGVKMIKLIEKLVGLNLVIPDELSTDILLLLLPPLFDGFVVNFNINKLENSLEKLFNMLTTYESHH